VRIAFSGSHRVGKSTLVEHLADVLHYKTVDEPYHLLEEQGYACAAYPTVEDFEAQLECALVTIEAREPNVLFDRCPVDILAYLFVHDDADAFVLDPWLERIQAAMQTIDLVVFVPVEEDDRIALSAQEDREQRSAVDEKLHELLIDDALQFEMDVLVVQGDLRARVKQVLSKLAAQGLPRRE
jgi:hypothetical protein